MKHKIGRVSSPKEKGPRIEYARKNINKNQPPKKGKKFKSKKYRKEVERKREEKFKSLFGDSPQNKKRPVEEVYSESDLQAPYDRYAPVEGSPSDSDLESSDMFANVEGSPSESELEPFDIFASVEGSLSENDLEPTNDIINEKMKHLYNKPVSGPPIVMDSIKKQAPVKKNQNRDIYTTVSESLSSDNPVDVTPTPILLPTVNNNPSVSSLPVKKNQKQTNNKNKNRDIYDHISDSLTSEGDDDIPPRPVTQQLPSLPLIDTSSPAPMVNTVDRPIAMNPEPLQTTSVTPVDRPIVIDPEPQVEGGISIGMPTGPQAVPAPAVDQSIMIEPGQVLEELNSYILREQGFAGLQVNTLPENWTGLTTQNIIPVVISTNQPNSNREQVLTTPIPLEQQQYYLNQNYIPPDLDMSAIEYDTDNLALPPFDPEFTGQQEQNYADTSAALYQQQPSTSTALYQQQPSTSAAVYQQQQSTTSAALQQQSTTSAALQQQSTTSAALQQQPTTVRHRRQRTNTTRQCTNTRRKRTDTRPNPPVRRQEPPSDPSDPSDDDNHNNNNDNGEEERRVLSFNRINRRRHSYDYSTEGSDIGERVMSDEEERIYGNLNRHFTSMNEDTLANYAPGLGSKTARIRGFRSNDPNWQRLLLGGSVVCLVDPGPNNKKARTVGPPEAFMKFRNFKNWSIAINGSSIAHVLDTGIDRGFQLSCSPLSVFRFVYFVIDKLYDNLVNRTPLQDGTIYQAIPFNTFNNFLKIAYEVVSPNYENIYGTGRKSCIKLLDRRNFHRYRSDKIKYSKILESTFGVYNENGMPQKKKDSIETAMRKIKILDKVKNQFLNPNVYCYKSQPDKPPRHIYQRIRYMD